MTLTKEEMVRIVTNKVIAELQDLDPELPPLPADSIPIGISARHLHLCREDLDRLFGDGYELTARNELYQPGFFAAEETVTLVTARRVMQGVRILFPLRQASQVEIARSDAIHLGMDAPVRHSGDIEGTPGMLLLGPHSALQLEQGVIVAARHVHMSPEDAAGFGVQDNDRVCVDISGHRSLLFRDVKVRVEPGARLHMHLDTDEANAADVMYGVVARIVPTP